MAAAVMAVVLGGAIAERWEEKKRAERILIDAGPDSVAGTRMSVKLPTGRLTMAVGEPVRTIPADDNRGEDYRKAITAPSGRVFLPFDVGVREDGLPHYLDLATRDIQVQPQVALRVEGHEYRLGTTGNATEPGDLDLPGYVQVREPKAEEPELELIVEFDGVAQRVDQDGSREAGDATGLYGLPKSLDSQDCSNGWTSSAGGGRATVQMSCHARAATYPYLSGHGWAHQREPGHTWAVVATETAFKSATLRRPDGRRSECVPWGPGKGITAFEGTLPVAVLHETAANTPVGSVVSQDLAFLVPERSEGVLRISRNYTCRSGPRRHTLDSARTMRVDLRP